MEILIIVIKENVIKADLQILKSLEPTNICNLQIHLFYKKIKLNFNIIK